MYNQGERGGGGRGKGEKLDRTLENVRCKPQRDLTITFIQPIGAGDWVLDESLESFQTRIDSRHKGIYSTRL